MLLYQSKDAGIRTLVMLDEQGGKNKEKKFINEVLRSHDDLMSCPELMVEEMFLVF